MERQAAGQHAVEGDAAGVDVGERADAVEQCILTTDVVEDAFAWRAMLGQDAAAYVVATRGASRSKSLQETCSMLEQLGAHVAGVILLSRNAPSLSKVA